MEAATAALSTVALCIPDFWHSCLGHWGTGSASSERAMAVVLVSTEETLSLKKAIALRSTRSARFIFFVFEGRIVELFEHVGDQQVSQHSPVLMSGQAGEWEHSVQRGSKHSPVPQHPCVQQVAQHYSPVHQYPSVQQVSQCCAITNAYKWSIKRVGAKCSACVAITSAAAFERSAQFAL